MPLTEQLPRFTFRKHERLCSEKAIENLFKSGKSFNYYPFRFVYNLQTNSDFENRIAITVPKRNFKRAVKRNLLKRYIREAYRIHKPAFYELLPKNITLSIMLLYVSPEIIPSARIAEKLGEALTKLASRITKSYDSSPVSTD